MKIAVLGTGPVGRALAGRLDELGHEVLVGTRDPRATAAKDDFATWAAEHRGVALAGFADVGVGVELVVNACGGAVALEVLAMVGSECLSGNVLVDVSNPLDFSAGFPPSLLVKDTDSLAEQIQRAFPGARVVKTLNTVTADVMIHPGALPEPTSIFVSGDDPEAKAVVTSLLESFGHTDVIDLGDITSARGPEMFLSLWVRTRLALGTNSFGIKVVR